MPIKQAAKIPNRHAGIIVIRNNYSIKDSMPTRPTVVHLNAADFAPSLRLALAANATRNLPPI